jgi:hypothetical protein
MNQSLSFSSCIKPSHGDTPSKELCRALAYVVFKQPFGLHTVAEDQVIDGKIVQSDAEYAGFIFHALEKNRINCDGGNVMQDKWPIDNYPGEGLLFLMLQDSSEYAIKFGFYDSLALQLGLDKIGHKIDDHHLNGSEVCCCIYQPLSIHKPLHNFLVKIDDVNTC